jgi:hypothetical protein
LVADSYKYLGIDFLQRRSHGKWNMTINRFIIKARSALGLVMFQGGGANGIRPRTMVHQWKSIVRPLLEYGCEMWEGEISDTLCEKLEAVQSRFCRASLGCKSLPAAAAVRADMGLCTLKSKRQRHKLAYWAKLCEAKSDRLLSLVFRNRHIEVCAGLGRLSSLNSFRSTLLALDFESCWNDCSTLEDWSTVFQVRSLELEISAQASVMANTSSLSLYAGLEHNFSLGLHPYLDDRDNLRGTRLMSRLRHGSLWLMQRVASVLRLPRAEGACLLCHSGEVEDALHFVLHCPVLARVRSDFRRALEGALVQAGVAGQLLLAKFCCASPEAALRQIAGLQQYMPPDVGSSPEQQRLHVEQFAKACWLFDKVAKNFLVACWRARAASIGSMKVVDKQLVHTPATASAPCSTKAFEPPGVLDEAVTASRPWKAWLSMTQPAPRVKKRVSNINNFFVVWVGRSTGIFYRWCDVWASVAGYRGAKFKGFESVADAYEAFTPPR